MMSRPMRSGHLSSYRWRWYKSIANNRSTDSPLVKLRWSLIQSSSALEQESSALLVVHCWSCGSHRTMSWPIGWSASAGRVCWPLSLYSRTPTRGLFELRGLHNDLPIQRSGRLRKAPDWCGDSLGRR
jgi:hypothetical protein